MKNFFFITILFFSVFILQAQIVNIPDANFKNALVNTNCADLDGDGTLDGDVDTNNDGEIQLSEAEAVFRLSVSDENINSLEGIQSFEILENLNCGFNQLTILDLTQNLNLKRLDCFNNQLSSINISQNLNLEGLNCYQNLLTSLVIPLSLNLEWLDCGSNLLMTLDVSQSPNLIYFVCPNNQLTNLDVSQNTALDYFICFNNLLTNLDVTLSSNLRHLNCFDNQLTSLDVSQNSGLELLSCQENNLTSLNIKNGNNINMTRMFAQNNPNLTCIQVDDSIFANNQVCNFPTDSWCKDEWAVYNEDCILSAADFNIFNINIYPNPTQSILTIYSELPIDNLKIYNLQGQLLIETKNNQIDVSFFPSGLYLVSIIIDGNKVIKKITKN